MFGATSHLAMKPNVGSNDAAVRSVAGFVGFFLGVPFDDWRGLLGLFPVATAVLAFCPLYVFFGFDPAPADESRAWCSSTENV